MNKKLESLLLNKKISALTTKERSYVAQHLSPQEYEKYQSIILESKNMAEQYKTTPAPKVKANLMAAMAEKKASKSSVSSIAHHPVPLWQVAAAAAVLFFCFWNTWPQQQPFPPTEKEIVYVHKTDTVYKETAPVVKASLASASKPSQKKKIKKTRAIHPTIDTMINKSTKPTTISAIPKIPKQPVINPKQGLVTIPPIDEVNINISPMEKTGRSVTTDRELMDFVGKVY